MSDNFERISENLNDPSRVRNFLRDAQNDAERKKYSLFFHVVYALLCSFAVYIATDSSLFSSTSSLFLFIAPAMCVFTFLYSPMYLKLAPIVLPPLFLLIRIAATGFKTNFLSVCVVLFAYLLCLLSAAVITKAVLSGHTKTTLFVSLSVVFGVVCFCQVMFSFIASFGTFSFSLLLNTINQAFDSFVNESIALSKTPEGLEMFRSLSVSGTELTDAQITKLVKESAELLSATIKPLLPSLFALSCMLYGFVTVAVFSLFAKHFRINVFVCIMDKNWTYRPSTVSAVVYDIVFFVFILSMFMKLPQNISVTVMNLMFVLTPLMYISGVRGIYSMLLRKTKKSSRSIIITTVIIVAATLLVGDISFLLVGSMGVSFITSRNREERLVIPVKYASDLAHLRNMSSKDSDTDTDTDSENKDSYNEDNPM